MYSNKFEYICKIFGQMALDKSCSDNKILYNRSNTKIIRL